MPERSPVSDWKLERYAAGDLPAEEARALEDQIEPDRLAAIRRANEETLALLPPARVASEVQRRTQRARRVRWAAWLSVPVAAMTILLLVPKPGPEERVKGAAHLIAYRQTNGEAEKLQPGAAVHPGDLIQLGYASGGRPFGVILSLDGRGGVTLHLPEDPHLTTALPAGEAALAHAYQLDDAPDFERFFLLTATHPLDVPRILEVARKLASNPVAGRSARLPLPSDVNQVDLLLQKQPR